MHFFLYQKPPYYRHKNVVRAPIYSLVYSFQLVRSLPSLIHLFTPIQPTPITFKKITTLLKPEFAAEGSNRMKAEKKVYSKFLKYLREAASKY